MLTLWHIILGQLVGLEPAGLATVRRLGATVASEGEPASLGPSPPPLRALTVDVRASQVLLWERLRKR